MRVFLDMDGVLADFVGGVCAAHGRPSPYLDPKNHGRFDIEKIWGMSPEEFWVPTNNVAFWENLPKTPEADAIVEAVFNKFGEKNVAILTSPSPACECFIGKKLWIAKNYPELKRKILYGSAKEFLAHKDSLLIDDRDKNVIDFKKAGGNTILIARPWNIDCAASSAALQFFTSDLEAF